ncbi:MAG TPA: NADH-quinone oxidoreductase subunit C, partial [Rhodothermales bacterium]|nr:NADH-quinone oxidoreductase subunit C [Rhodothermales bacterium]
MPDAPRTHETLKFFFTPVDPPRADVPNPHAKATTHNPEAVEALREAFGDAVEEVSEYAGETTVRVDRDRIVDVARFLHDTLGFTYLSDLGGVDRFTEEDRFEVFYNVISFERQKRLRLKIRCDEENPVVPSVTPVWPAANWHEREAWDMFGIRFEGHEDLRRMFMPEDFEYHPLRKEFPLMGIPGSLPLPPNRPEG